MPRLWPPTRLRPARVASGWALALVGPPLLTALLAQNRDLLGLPSDLMLFFTLVVGTAMIGGLLPSLTCAVLGSSLVNYFFTEPTGGLTIDDPEQALALVLFLLVAVAVATLVDVAERRSLEAGAARDEATALSGLSRAVLAGADTAQALVDELARSFSAPSAVLSERSGPDLPWQPVAWYPRDAHVPSSPLTGAVVTVAERSALALPDTRLGAGDRRVLEAFAVQASLVLERERLRERAARTRELEQGNAVRTALLNAASHDLRTPLAAIRAAVDGLTAARAGGTVVLSADDESALVETVDVSTSRLERLIDNLLDLSMLHTGALQPELREVSLEEVVPAAMDGFEADEVNLEMAESVPMVTTDPGLLERVLANVVRNAVQVAPAGVPVRVRAEVGPSTVDLWVVDAGPGVAPADRERMFEPFQRLGDSAPPVGGSGSPPGLGLGLAVARGLAQSLGVSLTAQDTPGGGLTMVIGVPRSPRPVPDAPDGGVLP